MGENNRRKILHSGRMDVWANYRETRKDIENNSGQSQPKTCLYGYQQWVSISVS